MNITYLLTALLVSLGINIVLFLFAYFFKTDKLTDAAYALSFMVLALFGFLGGEVTVSRLLVTGMVVVWAIRLGGFLLYRIQKIGRDQRFDAWRHSFWLLGRFWVLQAITAWVVMLPVLFALSKSNIELHMLAFIGFAIWLGGLSLESVADLQKFNFSQNTRNKDKWIAEGVWSWSRHPNYFGEMTVWVGTYITVFLSLSGVERVIGLASPLFIIGILLFATGIPILEKKADERWGSDKAYQDYKKRTSILIPRPPK